MNRFPIRHIGYLFIDLEKKNGLVNRLWWSVIGMETVEIMKKGVATMQKERTDPPRLEAMHFSFFSSSRYQVALGSSRYQVVLGNADVLKAMLWSVHVSMHQVLLNASPSWLITLNLLLPTY